MAIDPAEFWGDYADDNPPLNDDMIRSAERLLSVRLPKEYLDLLKNRNGGDTRGFAHPMDRRTGWAEDHVPLEHLAGIALDDDLSRPFNILQTGYMTREWGLPPRQVCLCGDGHWWITLDYRRGEIPSVAWIDLEGNEDFQVAETFRAFLKGLVPESEFPIDLGLED